MGLVATVQHGNETPNQRDKQQQIVDAARRVLARDGLAGCTARAVADASPLTKSAVHYYFHDINDLIDLAMAQHLDALLATLRQAAEDEHRPNRRLWRVVDRYLDLFAENPHAAMLWFEYWIARHHRGDQSPVRHDLDKIRALLHELVVASKYPTPDSIANAVLSWLLGTVVAQDVAPKTRSRHRRELERLIRCEPETNTTR